MNIDTNGKVFRIDCPFNENDIVMGLPNRRFHARDRVWVAPALSRNVEYLLKRCAGASWSAAARALATSVMKAVEIPAPAPIPVGYKFKVEPFEKQLECISRFWNRDVGAWFMGTGTGKSKVVIDVASIRFMVGMINAVVLYCPATVKMPWKKVEWERHCPVEHIVYLHDGDQKAFKAFTEFKTSALKVVLVSTEAMSIGPHKALTDLICKFMMAHRCYAPVDEGHDIKNHKSIRTENIIKTGKYCQYKTVMTGTPIDEGLMDVFPYFEYLNPNILGFGDYYSFRSRYAIMGGYEDKQIVSYQNVDELLGLIGPHVFQCTKEEMKDMPDKLYQRRYVKPTPAMAKHFKQINKEFRIEVEGADGENIVDHEVTTTLEKLMLEQYVASGFFSYNKTRVDPMSEDQDEEIVEREVFQIEAVPPKIKEALAWIREDIPKTASVILWSRWKREAELLVEMLRAEYGEDNVLWLKGGMGATKKDAMREKFEAREARFFVSHPAAGGVGLTLNAATYTGYLSNTFRYLHRQQSEDRNHRIGQEFNVTYMDFITEGIADEYVLEAIAQKHNVATWVDKTLRDRRGRPIK